MAGSRTALVTGATDGVGRVVAMRLGEAGVRVLVHGRDRARGARVVAEIVGGGGRAEFMHADLAALAEVRGLAEAVQARTDRLEILISNAGVGTGGAGAPRRTSADGYELRFAVNYLAGFLLTRLLLTLLRASAPARIVNVASAGQRPIDFDDVMLTRGYSGARAYCQSKLAQIMSTIDLAEELRGSGVSVHALHPGDLHGHDDGAPGGRGTDQQRGGGRGGDPEACRFARSRRQERALLQRDARSASQRAGL